MRIVTITIVPTPAKVKPDSPGVPGRSQTNGGYAPVRRASTYAAAVTPPVTIKEKPESHAETPACSATSRSQPYRGSRRKQ